MTHEELAISLKAIVAGLGLEGYPVQSEEVRQAVAYMDGLRRERDALRGLIENKDQAFRGIAICNQCRVCVAIAVVALNLKPDIPMATPSRDSGHPVGSEGGVEDPPV